MLQELTDYKPVSDMSIDEIDEEIETLNGSINRLQDLLNQLSEQISLLQNETEFTRKGFEAQIRALREEMENALQVLREAFQAKNELLRKGLDRVGALGTRVDALSLERAKRLELLQAQESLALIEERWAKMLMGVKWREWAKDHQFIASKQWAQQKTMILADDMGLGKTLESIMGLDFIQAATKDARPDNPYEAEPVQVYKNNELTTELHGGITKPSGLRVLYICPSSLIQNVISEFQEWAPHRTLVPIGNMPENEREVAFKIAKNSAQEFVMIINYEAWRFSKRLIPKLSELNFDSIILDEAHNFKETNTTTFQGIRELITKSNIGFVMPMTGTPILNKPEDFYPLLFIIDPITYPEKKFFLNEFCAQNFYTGKWEFKTGGEKRLRTKLGKRYLRRTKEDAGIVLPKRTIQHHIIEVIKEDWPEQAKARQSMKENFVVLMKKKDEYGNNKGIGAAAQIALYTRLRQIETWPAGIKLKDEDGHILETFDVEESQKLDYVINGEAGLLPDILSGNNRAIVFSQFVDPLREIRNRLEAIGRRAAVLTGETNVPDRDAISRDFDKRRLVDSEGYQYDVVLCHYRVGGVGLNLTAATHTIILDEEWNPGKRDQAYGRNYRIGQDEETTVHVLRMKNTIDDWLASIMDEKEKLIEGWDNAIPDLKDFLENTDESGLL